MGRGSDNLGVARGRRLPSAFARKERELKSLKGLSNKVFPITSEEEMKSFRASLFRQSPLWMRRAFLQFRREDLTPEEIEVLHQDDLSYLKGWGLSESLFDFSKRDADIASYLSALLSLRGREPFADKLINNLLRKAEEEAAKEEEVIIDVSQIEILLAACSENRYEEQLKRSLEKARDAFAEHDIPFPERTDVYLLPPFVSAMASNCDQTAAEEKGLRSGRYYPESDVILIADDRTIIGESLLIHELIHAVQREGGRGDEESLTLSADEEEKVTIIFEALTERLVDQLYPDEYFYPRGNEKRIWRKLEKRLDQDTLKQISLLPKEEMIRSLASALYPKEKTGLARLLRDLF